MEFTVEAPRSPIPTDREEQWEEEEVEKTATRAAGGTISTASTTYHPASRKSQGGGNQNDNGDQFPSHIRQTENASTDEFAEGIREEGYDGSHVRLLVGSFNVGNSPLTDLAPWLPYGGKGYDLIVVGLQESTYRPPRGGRDSPPQGSSLSPTNSLTPPQGVSPRWAAMQAGEMHDTSSPGVYLSPVPYPPTTAHETPQEGVDKQRESKGCARSGRGGGSSRLRSVLSPVILDKLFWSPSRENSPRRPRDGKGERCINDVAGGGDVEGGEDRGSGEERKKLSVVSTGDVHGTGKENVASKSSRNFARKGMEALDASQSESISVDRSVPVLRRRRPMGRPWSSGRKKFPKRHFSSFPSAAIVSDMPPPPLERDSLRLSDVDARDDSGGREGRKMSFWNPFSPRTPRSTHEAATAKDGKTPAKAGMATSTVLPSVLSQNTTPTKLKIEPSIGDRFVPISPSLEEDPPRRTVLGRDASTGKESSTSIAGGKDMSRLDRARKVLKKRRKEMDAGAMHLRSMLSGHLGPDFEQVISLRRMQMRVKVFLRRSLLDDYHRNEGESAAENTGIARVVANKGGLVCKLRLKGTTLCFVSCHLQAHEGQNHLSRRNASCAEILQGARLGDRRMIDVDSQFHHVFWLGDMNYRTNFGLSPVEQHSHVTKMVKAKDWMGLWKGDELMKELKNRRVLTGFQTEPPAFAPTFKTLRGEEEGYSSKRVPSYTDRILWKSLPGHAHNLELLKFVSFPEITSSDHKPIHAAFSVKLTPEVAVPAPEKKRRLFPRARIPAALEAPRKGQTQPVRLIFEDLQAIGLPPMAGGGLRKSFVTFSSDPKHLIKSNGGKMIKTESKKKTLNPRWNRKCTCHLAVSDPALLNFCHVSLMVMNRERGSKDELIGVANLSLADMVWAENLRPTTNSTTAFSPRSTFAATRLRSMPLLYRSSSSPPSYETKSPPPAVRGNSAIFAGIDYDVVEDFDDDEDDDDDVTDDGYDDDDDDDEEEMCAPRGEIAGVRPGVRDSGGSGSIVQLKRCQRMVTQDSDGMLPPHLPRLQFRHQQLQRVQRRGRTLPRHKSDGWLLQKIFNRGSFRGNDVVFPARVTAAPGRKLSEPVRRGIDRHRIDTGAELERDCSCLTPVRGKGAGTGGEGLAVSNARRNNQQASPFFHSDECRTTAEGGEADRGDEGEAQYGAQRFDVMLVGNGLPRGRISGRCYLSMGSGTGSGGGTLRLPSVGFYGGGSGGVDGGTGGDGKTNGHSGVEGSGDVSDPRLASSCSKKGGLRRLLPKLRGRKGSRKGSGSGGSRAVSSGATEREYESAAVRSGNHGSAVSLIVAPEKSSRTSSVNGSSASRRPSSASAAAAAATTAAAAAATAAVAAQGVRGGGHPAGCSLM